MSDDPDRKAQHRIPRTGNVPLAFTGRLLARAGSGRENGRDLTRWHELAVYETSGGQFVAHREWNTRYEGEPCVSEADVFASLEGAVNFLRDCDPCQYLRGFPRGEHYREKQRRLEDEIRLRYLALVGEVLERAGAEEVVE